MITIFNFLADLGFIPTIAPLGKLFFTIARLTNYHIAYFSSISDVIITSKNDRFCISKN